MKSDIQEELITLVSAGLAHSGLSAGHQEDIFLELPTDKRFGDFTTNIALKLSKELKQPPHVIASQLVESIREEIEKSDAGPFQHF
jgi:arginyl-tRNA synthetase